MANRKRDTFRYRPVSVGLSCGAGLSAICVMLMLLSGTAPAYAEAGGSGGRYRFQRGCADIPQCRTECENAETRSRELESCLVQDNGPMKSTNHCSMEQALEMRAFYTVVGCVIYFYPSLEIPLSEGE